MTLEEKLKTVSSEKLAERIESTEKEIGALGAELDQADAECLASVAEDVAYQKAEQRASDLNAEIARKRERLNRLDEAHKVAVEREGEEHRAALAQKIETVEGEFESTSAKLDEQKAKEEERHKKKTKELDHARASSELELIHAQIELAEANRARRAQELEAAGPERNDEYHSRAKYLSWAEHDLSSHKVRKAELETIIADCQP